MARNRDISPSPNSIICSPICSVLEPTPRWPPFVGFSYSWPPIPWNRYPNFFASVYKRSNDKQFLGKDTVGNGSVLEGRRAAYFERQNRHAPSRGSHSRGAKNQKRYPPRYPSRNIRGIQSQMNKLDGNTNCIICCMIVQDVEIGGYDIPCGAMIVPMQWAIHTDPAYWRDPLEFRPDRFLSDDGTFFKPESFLPFQNGKNGTFCSLFLKHSSLHLSYFKGKRVCVGEELARMILFLFAGRILRAFSVRVPAGEIADLEGECGITLVPKPHRLAFVGRDRWDFFFFYFFLLFLYEREKFHFEKIKYLLKIYSAGRTIRPFRKFSSNGRDGFRFSIRSPLHVFPLCCRGRFFFLFPFFFTSFFLQSV